MPHHFEKEKKKQILQESGYSCMICNRKKQPQKDQVRPGLDAHSIERSHRDRGMALCTVHQGNSCHKRLHEIAGENWHVLKEMSETAAQLAGLALADKLLKSGMPESRIRRRLTKRPF